MVDHDEELGQLLQQLPGSDARVVRSFTCNHQESSAPLDLRNINLNAAQCNLLELKVDPSSHGVDNRLRLLKDLLLHERAEVALHDLLKQACQHVRLEGRSGGGDHRHCGVCGGDGAKPLYPLGGDGVALGGGGYTTPAND